MADTFAELAIVTTPDNLLQEGWWESVVTSLEEGSQELVDLLVFLVSQKTPVRTGALLSSIEGIPNVAHNDPDLAYVYPSEGPQLDEYNRIYAPYVEGGPLGLPSRTITTPAEMFYGTANENLPEIEAWAQQWVQIGLDRVAAGEGVVI
jgi:hypothetical protein